MPTRTDLSRVKRPEAATTSREKVFLAVAVAAFFVLHLIGGDLIRNASAERPATAEFLAANGD
jgi:predicted lysophospholipase L1 biosynthesis ABC-type transport system permease subunit